MSIYVIKNMVNKTLQSYKIGKCTCTLITTGKRSDQTIQFHYANISTIEPRLQE